MENFLSVPFLGHLVPHFSFCPSFWGGGGNQIPLKAASWEKLVGKGTVSVVVLGRCPCCIPLPPLSLFEGAGRASGLGSLNPALGHLAPF